MSDLQIITGIAILVSGYATITCGLSAYHWQVLVYLAWFSAITHMSALTFLRNYLYNHQGERLWRLISMAFFQVMLIVAMVPTANFNWLYDSGDNVIANASDYAVCFFQIRDPTRTSFTSMMMSIIILLFNFGTRGIKLHKTLSDWVLRDIRKKLSVSYRRGLKRIHNNSAVEGHPLCWKRTILYRPLLAAFLVGRLVLDLYSSMFFEVGQICLLVSLLEG